MLSVLVQGRLTADPRTREASNGNPYTTAQLACETDGGSVLVGVIAFAAAGERLAALRKGESLAVSGTAKLTTWEKSGEQHCGLSVTAAEVLTVYVGRQRRSRSSAPGEAEHGRAA